MVGIHLGMHARVPRTVFENNTDLVKYFNVTLANKDSCSSLMLITPERRSAAGVIQHYVFLPRGGEIDWDMETG